MMREGGKAKYRFHSLRHFYVSLMIEQGTPPKRLQALIGHANLSMTMDVYGHLFPPSEEDTARINSAIASVLVA
jgi:integrase